MKKQISAGGVLVNPENKVYLIRKIERDEWSLPKGKVDEGETIMQAALREVKEETGYLDAEIISNKCLGWDKYRFKSSRNDKIVDKEVYFYLMKTESNEQTPTPEMEKEGLDGKWFTLEEAEEKLEFKSLKNIVSDLPTIVSPME